MVLPFSCVEGSDSKKGDTNVPKLQKRSAYVLQVDEDELEAIITSLNEKSGSMTPEEGSYYENLALILDTEKKRLE